MGGGDFITSGRLVQALEEVDQAGEAGRSSSLSRRSTLSFPSQGLQLARLLSGLALPLRGVGEALLHLSRRAPGTSPSSS